MFSSIFSTSPPVDPTAPNFHPVSSKFPESDLCGELEHKDNEWLLCTEGFVAETQTFYAITDEGTSVMCQVIHSSTGLWYPTIQFTCKIANPAKGINVWKSINVKNFAAALPGLDTRSSKADEFSITFKTNPGSDFPDSCTIRANLGLDLQVIMELLRPSSVPAYKVGKGTQGGYSYFGTDPQKADGYVVHRFWPRVHATGHITRDMKADPFKGYGMFVHAIQGMRPNLVASAWNFAHFQSNELGGVSAIQMEFTTLKTHGKHGEGSGPVVVNVGSLVIGDKLASVTAETKWPGEKPSSSVVSRTTQFEPENDPDTGYGKPTEIVFEWKGRSILSDAPGALKANVKVDVGTVENPKGLIEKVDVLAEIPYIIRKAAAYIAGTKPYIYQWLNPSKLSITGPDSLGSGLSSGVEIEGMLYNEATFISY